MIRTLFICSGNLCRSPMAEVLFARLTAGLPVETESAGTLELEGRKSPREVIAAGERLGVDLRDHRSLDLGSAGDLADFDLVIGMAREHLAAAVVDYGARPERTFTMIELVELLGELYGGDEPAEDTGPAGAGAAPGGAVTSERAGPGPIPPPVGAEGAEALAHERIKAANDLRGGVHAFAISADIPDPIGGPKRAYEAMADAVSDLSERLARGLFGDEAVSSSLPKQTD